jgi:RHH-type proline utilization regulon transcriptional repressor/proline dehydrogenase/delta 1-pyrroline-5-carboxylate dehydrogenase
VQAYSKRAGAVIDWLAETASALDRKLMVRLVKGAYWDTEIKRAQERGLADYPLFTRKAMTDLHYLSVARRMLARRDRLYPQFATHNALTVASLIEAAGGVSGYEFQRLHGMGGELYDRLLQDEPEAACRTYAPVGGHRDLLAYLVRRLLENGANSSFVSVAADPAVPVASLLVRPERQIGDASRARHARIPLPRDLYGAQRRNSAGIEFGSRTALAALIGERDMAGPGAARAASLIGGKPAGGLPRPVIAPATGATIGTVIEADVATAARAMSAAARAHDWMMRPVAERAACLDRAADLLEARRGRFLALLQSEAGKTLDDALAELREAVDFCRYYAARARLDFGAPHRLPGPTGEDNTLIHRGRGVFVCISPWNFPLAIFLGQVTAALVAGNAVVAKPAEQTPLIAAEAVTVLHEAGVPAAALALVCGDGTVGAALVAHADVAGVAFTGSTEVARKIHRALAAKDGPIVPLIAETGGINAMIVDATALPEQVTDDVVMSAFRSAGQRCSALRLLIVQDDVADKVIEMIAGAARELKLGDPRDPSVHVGPVIDAEARARLDQWIAAQDRMGRVLFRWDRGHPLPVTGTFVPPVVIRLERVEDLTEEVFGPVLHVVRYQAGDLTRVVEAIAATGYGLTLGVHSRIDDTVHLVTSRLTHGNIYVNRNMIGAVVGTQPFGGSGLSGTGPKAGGPAYLQRFALEQVVTVNTTAAGGNATLLASGEE